MPCWKKISFLFMNLCLRLNYSSLYSFVSVVGVCRLLSLVVYSLPRRMATSDYDVIAGAVREEEYKKTTWFNEPRTLARTERRCLRVIQRQCDASQRDTLHALENVIALIVGEEQGYRFGHYKQWEADFLRHLLGHTTFEEEQAVNEKSQENFRFCDVSRSLQMKMGKKFTSLLRHGSILKNEMYPNGAVDMDPVFDCCGNDVNPLQQFTGGRQFCSTHTGQQQTTSLY